MRRAKVVIGAGFGDEGKGLMTDYFCSQFPAEKPVLNVRFNGGAQAGHTVVSPDGRRHVFGHFGAGSFNRNVVTYLGPEFIVNPILFRREWEKLVSLGVTPLVYIHPKCLLTIPQDMMLNQIVERWRGDNRHGSCGVGIYETLYRSKINRQIYVDDPDASAPKNILVKDYSEWHLEDLGVATLTEQDKKLLSNQNILAHYQDDLNFLRAHTIIKDESIIHEYDHVVFEGAQGLMLDQNNKDYFPHLTPSNTGMKNVKHMLNHMIFRDDVQMEVCYVTRTYLTRHGAGRFDTECPREFLHGVQADKTNHYNEFQQNFRYGFFDIDQLNRAVYKDDTSSLILNVGMRMSFAITHMDETGGNLLMRGYEVPASEIFAPGFYSSYGPTRMDVRHE